MPGIIDLEATREALRELIRIVKHTRQTLAAMIQENDRPERLQTSSRSGQFSDALKHLGDVREGFILSQRTSPQVSLAELRELVQHILLDWNWLQELDLILAPGHRIETLKHQLIAYNHALVALSVLPHLPAEAITFPQPRPTYDDVAIPALPGEKLARIEEIEHIIYQIETMALDTLAYDSFRRTYAFFEASTWLVSNHLEPLLGG